LEWPRFLVRSICAASLLCGKSRNWDPYAREVTIFHT
jgi:hypothetical protein